MRISCRNQIRKRKIRWKIPWRECLELSTSSPPSWLNRSNCWGWKIVPRHRRLPPPSLNTHRPPSSRSTLKRKSYRLLPHPPPPPLRLLHPSRNRPSRKNRVIIRKSKKAKTWIALKSRRNRHLYLPFVSLKSLHRRRRRPPPTPRYVPIHLPTSLTLKRRGRELCCCC